uniref:Uncharacterized protein n=1 Tax=Lactuca sativa TaxID=4236 RepID=A0A9R1W4W1_LACSA|nr:hypothetical protein LSAT_V11C300151140 [Lactuca sativa]
MQMSFPYRSIVIQSSCKSSRMSVHCDDAIFKKIPKGYCIFWDLIVSSVSEEAETEIEEEKWSLNGFLISASWILNGSYNNLMHGYNMRIDKRMIKKRCFDFNVCESVLLP